MKQLRELTINCERIKIQILQEVHSNLEEEICQILDQESEDKNHNASAETLENQGIIINSLMSFFCHAKHEDSYV